MHTLEVFDHMMLLTNAHSSANKELALALALIHDIGKIHEYQPRKTYGWEMSTRGRLIGHKLTAIEMVASAVSKYQIQLKHGHFECLIHGLSSAANAPEWCGIRQTATLEAHPLSIADRLSATSV